MRTGENAKLLLHDRDAQRGILRDLRGELERERFDLGGGDDVVDHTSALRMDSINWPTREGHLFRHPQTGGIEQREHSADIVWYSELRRRDREGGGLGGNDEVADKYRLRRSAPDTPFDHGNDRSWEILDLAHELSQGVIPAQRVPSRFRQLGHIMAR